MPAVRDTPRTLLGLFDIVHDYGALPGLGDCGPALNAAMADAAAQGGGKIRIPAGSLPYNLATTATVPHNAAIQHRRNCNITIEGDGKGAATLLRTADVIGLDVSGSSASEWLIGVNIRDLTLDGGGGAYTQPMMRTYYTQFLAADHVDMKNARGTGIDGVQIYDSYFTDCRWDACGNSTSPAYACHFKTTNQGASVGSFGYSNDSSNNLWFVNCVWEENYGGCVYLDGRQSDGSVGNTAVNQCHFVNCKMENHTGILAVPFLRMSRVSQTTILSLKLGVGQLLSGASTVRHIICENGCYGIEAMHVTANLIEGAATATKSIVYLDGTIANDAILFKHLSCTAQSTHKPAVALVETTGTNTNIDVRPIYTQNPGGAALWSGSTGISTFPRPSIFVKGLVDRVHAIFQKNGTQSAAIAEVRAADGSTVLGAWSPNANLSAQNLFRGSGSPEGVVTAGIGSFYTDTTNGEAYIKHTGTGNTGWKQVTRAA